MYVIKQFKNSINDYQHGKIVVNITKLRALIGEFFSGWSWWVSGKIGRAHV